MFKQVAPTNKHKKAEYDKNQQLLLALHEQAKLEYTKKMDRLDEIEKKKAQQRLEIKNKVHQKVQENRDTVIQMQKKLAVEKAADVIKRFEQQAKYDPKVNMKRIRKAVMANLIERNKHLDPNKDYWSMQLLVKLGILPDVEEATTTYGDTVF